MFRTGQAVGALGLYRQGIIRYSSPMCGRYVLYGPQSRHTRDFEVDGWPDFPDRYNIAPSLEVPIIRQSPEGVRVAQLLRWGLIPHWAKDPALGNKLTNARGESVADKPSFRSALKQRRCLIPASGFYEWQAEQGGRKQPWYIHLKGDVAMAMGGLWERWTSPDGEILRTFCVITTAPNEIMQPIHDRMPVIIPKWRWADWLNPQNSDAAEISGLLIPYDAAAMEAWPVSRRVSNSREEGAELISPLPADLG